MILYIAHQEKMGQYRKKKLNNIKKYYLTFALYSLLCFLRNRKIVITVSLNTLFSTKVNLYEYSAKSWRITRKKNWHFS